MLATVLVARMVGIKERVQSLGPERWLEWCDVCTRTSRKRSSGFADARSTSWRIVCSRSSMDRRERFVVLGDH